MGWTLAESLATDVNAIEIALGARSELLTMIFGSGEKGKPKRKRKGKVTAEGFRAFRDRVNGGAQGG